MAAFCKDVDKALRQCMPPFATLVIVIGGWLTLLWDDLR